MVDAHSMRQVIDKGDVLALEPLIAEKWQGDVVTHWQQAALLLHKLSPLLVVPILNDMAHFIDKHIEIRGVAKFNIDRLGAISELKAEQTGASSVRSRENLLNAFEEEALVWVGPLVVVFNCVDGY